MIPILYESTATTYTTNGIGRLSDCVSCLVTEERNGIFEVEFQYPVTGRLYSEIIEGRIISVMHDDTKTRQPFIIYRRSAPIDGLVTFNAHHVSYELAHSILQPFTASSVGEAFSLLPTKSITPCGFTFWTNKIVSAAFSVKVPASIRETLGGTEGSILDTFGSGEYEWDNFTVKFWQNRGSNSGITLRYGKNLTDLTQEKDVSEMYNACVPYWTDGEQTVTLGTTVLTMSGVTDVVAVPMDMSDAFEEAPTTAQLQQAAQTRLDNSGGWKPDENIEIDFVALWQTDEYAEVAPLQNLKLCDTITVVHPALGLTATAKVIKTVYNALLEKYDAIEIGDPKTSFADALSQSFYKSIVPVAASARHALKIAGDTDQHFWFTETGTDTGAHITEKTKEDFLDDPTTGGGNLLARSNGVAVRTGLTELAQFSANGLSVYAGDGYTQIANLGYGLGNAQSGTAYAPYYTLGTRAGGSAIGNYSVAEGSNTTASAWAAHAEGYETTASELWAHAEGHNTTASGLVSHAEGEDTVASGRWSHAEGSDTTASADYAHAEGIGSAGKGAKGRASHSEGWETTASGTASHAEGDNTTASGNGSHAGGYGTIASGNYQTVIGRLNEEKTDYVFIVGNGSQGVRSNAFAIDWDGSAEYAAQDFQIPNNSPTVVTYLRSSTINVHRRGNVCQITGEFISKTISSRVTVYTLPEKYRPISLVYGFMTDMTNYFIITPQGGFMLNAMPDNSHMWFSITYVCG